MFILSVVILIGIICTGVLGAGGTAFWVYNERAQAETLAAATPIPTEPPPTATPTNTPITPTPTNTPEPSPTGTLVVIGTNTPTMTPISQPNQDGSEAAVEPESTPRSTPTSEPTPMDSLVLQPTEPSAEAIPITNTPTSISVEDSSDQPISGGIPESGGILESEQGTLVWAGLTTLLLLIFGVLFQTRRV